MFRILHYSPKLALISLCIIFSSCSKDWFDVKSDSNLTVPASLDDMELLLDNYVKINRNTPGLSEVGSDGHYMPEGSWSSPSIADAERNAYTWSNTLLYREVEDWNLAYEKISICNIVLSGLQKLSSSHADQSRLSSIMGNALFIRAKSFYELAQIYAPQYDSHTASTNLGIPLKTGIDVTEQSFRSKLDETYNQITNDLMIACQLLPKRPQVVTRASKVSCYGMLARVYLTMGEYERANKYADSSFQVYNKLIDFNSISPSASNLGQFNEETIYFSLMITRWFSAHSNNFVYVDPELYALYDDNDLRKTRFFRINSGNIIYKGNYNTATARFTGIATDEIYLILAETYARLGNATLAMKFLNDLLRTRWSNAPGVIFPENNTANPEEALEMVLTERRKELLFRNLRWSDLRRLNLDDKFKTTLTRIIGGQTYTLEPNSYKYTLPIPNDIMGLAPLMKQNPGWD